jgi:hypothetical protein
MRYDFPLVTVLLKPPSPPPPYRSKTLATKERNFANRVFEVNVAAHASFALAPIIFFTKHLYYPECRNFVSAEHKAQAYSLEIEVRGRHRERRGSATFSQVTGGQARLGGRSVYMAHHSL